MKLIFTSCITRIPAITVKSREINCRCSQNSFVSLATQGKKSRNDGKKKKKQTIYVRFLLRITQETEIPEVLAENWLIAAEQRIQVK